MRAAAAAAVFLICGALKMHASPHAQPRPAAIPVLYSAE